MPDIQAKFYKSVSPSLQDHIMITDTLFVRAWVSGNRVQLENGSADFYKEDCRDIPLSHRYCTEEEFMDAWDRAYASINLRPVLSNVVVEKLDYEGLTTKGELS